jgi:hypothetical protein
MILVYFDVSAADQLTVYRWIDKENVVHFSQHQPDHDDYIEFSVANNKNSTATINKTNTPGESQPSDIDFVNSIEAKDLGDNLSDSKCVTARKNIDTLQNFDKIQYKDEKGKVKVLSALEKQQQLEMNTKQAEVYCTD